MGHPIAFDFAERLAAIAPGGLDRVFFTNSGSESVDTALKIALAYHRSAGQPTRTRLIGRERGYHGVGFGGMSVGGMVEQPQGVRHASSAASIISATPTISPATRSPGDSRRTVRNWPTTSSAWSRCTGLETIAAVIVEPVAGSTGVLIPPQGYLQRLRALCDKHGILLIFDEVITGFGRLGTPFATELLRRHARSHHLRQGHHQRHDSDGRGVREPQDPRRADDRTGQPDRAVPRLYLFRASGGLRGRDRDAGDLSRKRVCSRAAPRSPITGRTPCIRCAACRT